MNKKLNFAFINKNDEFYTRYNDIEKELKNYVDFFKDKIIYCNCDSIDSNFFKYFYDNFDKLKLKKLIISCYFRDRNGYHLIISKNDRKIVKKQFKHNGDFRNKDCINLLKHSDIAITNPPFSLFNDYLKLLYDYKKDFIIVGNSNNVSSKFTFDKILSNDLKIGYNCVRWFNTPDNILKEGARSYWYTNLDINQIKPYIKLTKNYNEIEYQKYDNYNAIEVSKVKDIPNDYYGVMGLPITFLQKFNSNQFELIGADFMVCDKLDFLKNKNWCGKFDRGYINGNRKYARIFIKRKL